MKKRNELSYKELKMICNPQLFSFETTEELQPITSGIGQDRGIKALEFGINVDIKGYNLYLEGPTGVGKTMYTKNYLDKISKKKKTPSDWCYVYNFDDPNEPVAIPLNAGLGKEFRDTMDAFIKDIQVDIKNTFNNDDFEKEKALIKGEFDEKRNVLMEKLNKDSEKHGFQVKSAQNGIYMMPILNGKTIEQEDFEKLDESIKQQFEEKSVIVQEQIIQAIGEIKEIEKQTAKRLEEWQSNIALLTVNQHINYIKSKFKRNKKITKFLDSIKKDILKNIDKNVSMLQDGISHASSTAMVRLIAYAAALIPLVAVLAECVSSTFHGITTMQKQMEVIYPIMMTLMAACGNSVTVAVCRPAVAFFATGISNILCEIVLPLTLIIMAFSLVGNLSKTLKIGKFTAFFKSVNKWIIGVSISVFGLFFTLQGITAASYDGVMRRAAKYAIGNGVPIVGGFLSGGFDLAVAGGILIKNSLGSMSIVLMLSVLFEPLIMLIAINLLLRLVSAITQPFGEGRIFDFFGETAENLHYCTAGILFTAFLYFLSIMVMIFSTEALL